MEVKKSITKSKIICTIGPATDSAEQIKKLSGIGMDCARINFSHGTDEYKSDLFKRIRSADGKLAILCDIQGPKIRIGTIKEGGVTLHPGNKIILTTQDVVGDEKRITINYGKLPEEIKPGELIFINDGIVCLKVEKIDGTEIGCHIRSGGFLTSRKGVNLPSTKISLTVPTEKDVKDLKLIAGLDPEFVAMSFIGTAADVMKIRKILADFGNKSIKLISKIERPVALTNFDNILKVSDGIMVARGDLGVEIPPEQVIPFQKDMIWKCNIAGKPIIVATQMLESMIKSPVPTRAEVSDVFNAIEDGADAVMLSAETASGSFPAEAVLMMERVIKTSEALFEVRDPDEYDSEDENTSEIIGHLVYAAGKEFSDIKYKKGKIICLTASSHTAKMISKYRPFLPIIGITSNVRTAREMRLIWGVEPLHIPELEKIPDTVRKLGKVSQICLEKNYIEKNEKLIIAGNLLPLGAGTNMITITSAGKILKNSVSGREKTG